MTETELFSLQIKEDGVFLQVASKETTETAPDLEAVLNALALKKIADYNRLAVEEAVRQRSGSPVKIAEAQKSAPPAEISVLVSRDRMEAFLQIDLPVGGIKPSTDEVLDKIEKSGVMFGLMPESVEQALRQPNLRVLCARGQFPENGQDARVEHKVDLSSRGKPVETADGGVDYKNLGLYINVEKGQVLAEKIPPTAGIPGTDVCGNSILPRAGKDVLLQPGTNVQIVDGVKLVAAVGGNLMVAGGKMTIAPILTIKGDVDLSTGNIDFAGDVVIQGSVQEGFTVKAGGNIEVGGMISGAHLQGFNITVRQGILGLHKGTIKAAGTVAAKFIENARVSSERDILVTDVVMHSQLSAVGKIKVEGRRGQIVGGVAAAGDEIQAKSVGTASAIPTELQAGVNPKLREELLATRKELKAAETSLDQLQKGLFTLRSMDPQTMPPEKKELQLKITRAQFSTLGQVENLRKKLNELEMAYEELRGGQIKVSDYVFPGVKVIIGQLVKPIQEEYRFVVFYADGGEIKFRPFK